MQNPNHFSQNSWINAGIGTSFRTSTAPSNSNRSNRRYQFLLERNHIKKNYKDVESINELPLVNQKIQTKSNLDNYTS